MTWELPLTWLEGRGLSRKRINTLCNHGLRTVLAFGGGPWRRVAPQICPLQLPIRACGGQSGELDMKNVSTKVYVGYVRPGAPS